MQRKHKTKLVSHMLNGKFLKIYVILNKILHGCLLFKEKNTPVNHRDLITYTYMVMCHMVILFINEKCCNYSKRNIIIF